MIKKISACNRMDFSSNINEVIRAVLNSLFFYLQKDFARTKKHQNATEQKYKTQISKNKKCA